MPHKANHDLEALNEDLYLLARTIKDTAPNK
jgi:hypothetical protein